MAGIGPVSSSEGHTGSQPPRSGTSEEFADEIFGFHAQQAAEKALRAWLAVLDAEYPRTHDLSMLISLFEVQEQDIVPFFDIIELNPYAV